MYGGVPVLNGDPGEMCCLTSVTMIYHSSHLKVLSTLEYILYDLEQRPKRSLCPRSCRLSYSMKLQTN